MGSFKSQMKRADASGAAYAIIIGEDEIASGTAIVKHLRDADMNNNQQNISLDAITEHLIDQISGDSDHDHGHLHAGQLHTHH